MFWNTTGWSQSSNAIDDSRLGPRLTAEGCQSMGGTQRGRCLSAETPPRVASRWVTSLCCKPRHTAHMCHCVKTWHHSQNWMVGWDLTALLTQISLKTPLNLNQQNRKYIMYCTVIRGRSSHDTGNIHRKFRLVWTRGFSGMQVDRHTDIQQTDIRWSHYFATLLGRSRANKRRKRRSQEDRCQCYTGLERKKWIMINKNVGQCPTWWSPHQT